MGNIEEELEDSQNALLSYNEAVRKAPYYAHTRWQRGNLLLRMGQNDEAFNDLRAAAKSNRIFVPNFMDLAWALAGKNVKKTESILQIEDDYTRLAFAKFLARNGEGEAALDQLSAVSISVPVAAKKEIISRLLGSKSYKAAFELSNSLSGKSENGATQIYDGGFETKISFDERGVSWQIPAGQPNVTMAQDSTVKESGEHSLRITFSGNSTPGVHLLSETVLASPEKRYRINFEFRVQNLVTGGPPQLVVSDACTDEVLGRLVLPAQSDNEWHSLSVDFSTKQNCDAIVLHLSRISCTTTPCPIFGVLWLDSFSIQELLK